MTWIVAAGIVVVIAIAIYDLTQRQHAILRTFPIIGHFRYRLEAVGPELRQYIVTGNNEERPFSRDQRRWIYASAKRENNYFGFGSDNEMERQPSYLIIKHDTFPLEAFHPGDPEFDPQFQIPCAKVIGGARRHVDDRGGPKRTCSPPAGHRMFRNADEMLDFVELIASETGLPVGIKSAVGDSAFWEDLRT